MQTGGVEVSKRITNARVIEGQEAVSVSAKRKCSKSTGHLELQEGGDASLKTHA